MEKFNYKIEKANQKQINWLFDNLYKNDKKRDCSIVFLAVEYENIIGYVVIEEMEVPPPLNGSDWFIWHIFTLPYYRRQGIASALLEETIKHAETSNIRNLLGSANPTIQAHSFWFKHNFCFQKYGSICDDENYYHMIFRRMNKIDEEIKKEQGKYHIMKADKEQTDWIFNDYILNLSPEYFRDKKDDIFALIAVDKNTNTIGFITAYEDEIYAPLDGTQWVIPYIFVKPEFQRQGIGTAFVRELIQSAKEINITQLTAVRVSDAPEFWDDNNFDMFHWSLVGKNNTAVVAGLRIK